MKINIIYIIFFLLILNSCALKSQNNIDKKFLTKISNQNYDENKDLNKLYISEGHFECSKSFENNYRLQRTSDGLYDSFMYITDKGKIYFGTIPTSNFSKKNMFEYKNEIPNAIFYKKNEKFIIERKSVTHPIFGIGGGYVISKGEIIFKNHKIFIIDNSDKNHCEIYKEHQ